MSHPVPPTRPNAAEVYEQFLVPAVFAPWANELLARACLRTGERVLDVGCGTGIVSRTAAHVVGPTGKVTGLDMNPIMLSVARSAVPPTDSALIEWIEGSAEALRVPDSSFDLVTFQQVLQFVPDRLAALREAHRVLVPGGRIALGVFAAADLHPAHQTIDQVLARHLGRSALLAGFGLSDPSEIRSLLEQAGFQVRSLELVTKESRFHDPEHFARPFIVPASASIPSFRQLDVAAREELIANIAKNLAPVVRTPTNDNVVVFPWHAHIAIASA